MSNKIVKYNQACPCGKSSDALQVYDDGHSFCFSGKCGGTFFPPEGEAKESEHASIRGIPLSAIKKFDVTTVFTGKDEPLYACLPFPNGNAKFRNMKVDKNGQGKYYNIKGQTPGGLFGMDKFPPGSSKYITLTEGEFDAVAAYAMLKHAAVSAPSGLTLTDEEWTYLDSFERIYFCFDNDTAGKEKLKKFLPLFPHNKCYVVTLSKHKDPNDYLIAGDAKLFEKEWWAAKNYSPDYILNSADDFLAALSGEESTDIVPTFIEQFNSMAYGLPTGHIVLIKGQEGLGKTEVLRKLAWHTFKTTEHPVATIFLEESVKRTVQGFATLEIGKPVHLPDSDVPKEHVAQVAKEIGQSGRMNIIKMVDIEDNDRILEKVRYLVTQRGCKFVFLDPINQLASHGGDNVTRELDNLMTRLEKMVVDEDFCLVVTAHVNDEGLTRDSRMIQKAASIRIELERDHMNPDPIIKNTTKLAISKNRPFSATGPCGTLVFDPTSFDLKEINPNQTVEEKIADDF